MAPVSSRPEPVQDALDFIRAGGEKDGEAFNRLALAVFAFQFEHNAHYRRFCRRRGATPESATDWREIPPVPTAAFKDADLSAAPASRVFTTSGTTRGTERRGRHLLPEIDLYEASWVEPFRRHLLPDRETIRMLSLIPSPRVLPESSLSFMAGRALGRFADAGSGWFLHASGLDGEGLHRALAGAEASGEPVLALGTALAFWEWMYGVRNAGRRYALPEGSRIMDTGGFKGRVREASRDALMDFYTKTLGVAEDHVVGEYGMTELCSQFYEATLANAVQSRRSPGGAPGVAPASGGAPGVAPASGRAPGVAPASGRAPGVAPRDRSFARGVFVGPPWTRTRVLDPLRLDPLPDGRPGLLAHWDLANAWTVLAVVTEDLGVREGDGFRLLGRADAAELRGCSLATEEMLHG